MRARNIKPGSFSNELLGTGPIEAHLLFIGLPMLADRSGIVEDRPLRIRAAIFPYRVEVEVDPLLDYLASNGFITRYESEKVKLIHVTNFLKHQNPHKDDKPSLYRTPMEELVKSREVLEIPRGASEIPQGAPAESLNPGSLKTEPLNPYSQNLYSQNPDYLTSASARASESPAGGIPVEQDFPAGHQSKSNASEFSNPPSLDDEDFPMRNSEPPRMSKAKSETTSSTEVEQVFSAWSKICAQTDSPFSEVTPATRAKHAPTIIKFMEDDRWLPWCLEVIQWLPSSDFNAGRVPPREGKLPHVLAFGALIKRVQLLHEDVVTDAAKREKLAKARLGSDVPPTHQQGELLGGLYDRMQAKRDADNRLDHDEEFNDGMRLTDEEAERLRLEEEAVEEDEEYR